MAKDKNVSEFWFNTVKNLIKKAKDRNKNEVARKQTFQDLEFKQHRTIPNGTLAKMEFPDGSKISIITGDGTYSGTGSYEMLSNRTNRKDGIQGWITPEEITRHMKYIQKTPKK